MRYAYSADCTEAQATAIFAAARSGTAASAEEQSKSVDDESQKEHKIVERSAEKEHKIIERSTEKKHEVFERGAG